MYYIYNQLRIQVFCIYIYISKALNMYTVIPIQSFVKLKKIIVKIQNLQYDTVPYAAFLWVGLLNPWCVDLYYACRACCTDSQKYYVDHVASS